MTISNAKEKLRKRQFCYIRLAKSDHRCSFIMAPMPPNVTILDMYNKCMAPNNILKFACHVKNYYIRHVSLHVQQLNTHLVSHGQKIINVCPCAIFSSLVGSATCPKATIQSWGRIHLVLGSNLQCYLLLVINHRLVLGSNISSPGVEYIQSWGRIYLVLGSNLQRYLLLVIETFAEFVFRHRQSLLED